eukprot:8061542-Pyramimonas_sp.AAC.1
MLGYDLYCKTCVAPLQLQDCYSAAFSLMQYSYWLNTVSQYHQYNTRIMPLLQYYGCGIVLRRSQCHHYRTRVL